MRASILGRPSKNAVQLAAIAAILVLPVTALAQEPAPEPRSPPSFGDSDAPPAPKAVPRFQRPPVESPQTEPRQQHGQTAQENPEKLLEELYTRLASAPDEATAAEIATAVEQLWQHSGSATADLLVARAAAATEANRRDLAMRLLNAAVELQPDFAEAWNRRAYLFYLADDYKRALGDLRRVLALEPHHYKALEGLANILQHLGEKNAALEAYESLLKVHPQVKGGKKARDDLKVEVEGQGI